MIRQLSLFFCSRLYAGVTRWRNLLYDARILPRYRSKLPVVSIGNVTAGGNAKTPLCRYLAEALHSRGHRPVILTRGYGGKLRKTPHLVNEYDAADLVGDEPLLLHRQTGFPVVVCPNRVKGAKYIEGAGLGDVIILDDGFQHRRLDRTVDILSVNVGTSDAIESFIGGQLLPLGLFREAREPALQRADMLIFSERRYIKQLDELDRRLFKLVPPSLQLYRSYIQPVSITSLDGSSTLEPTHCVAFCGLANPEPFYLTLEELGFKVLERISYPDHHPFSAQDVRALLDNHPELPLVCTQKDAVKLSIENGERIYVLQVETKLHPTDAFIVQVTKLIMAARRSQEPFVPGTPNAKTSEQ